MADTNQKLKEILTYKDYLSLPNDSNRYQILEGELVITPSPSVKHQKVSRNLEFILFSYIKDNDLGEIYDAPIDVMLDNINIVVPDIVFVLKDRINIIEDNKIVGAPDLVIEILSHSSVRYDRIRKTQIYSSHGVEWYWIVDAENQTLEEYHLEGSTYRITGAYDGDAVFCPLLFKGLEIQLPLLWI